ncbi:flagellar type III secretion system pore protein FliP [Allorhodopirellula heiligendammensis]|uniref:Flagellar biosynthetic protein FliP n=1 Tax=Allorhodopirellula heiligendammensis TaxID=2714739 RepID=A0A5C6BVE6_9BACT|nr:flagellar type III secretion system pore protein FliP [Allorhodopirellula heiligendammensis]TWU16253.1 Flagellar biosynthetic protein FliP precursor [Allorhodopirellula heiligendammensis]
MFLTSACRICLAGVALLVLATGVTVSPLRADEVASGSAYMAMRAGTPAPIRVGAGDRIGGIPIDGADIDAIIDPVTSQASVERENALPEASPASAQPLEFLNGGPENWTSPEGLSGSLQSMLLLTVLSLAPAVLLMTTCYVRIIIVLGLLKQAIGLQSLPPSQVMTSVALFMTLFVMTPVWTRVYDDAIAPYTDPEIEMTLIEAYDAGSIPVREFMSRQIDTAGNHDDVHLFYSYMDADAPLPSTFSDVPIRVLLPAFILSELKTAFLMGFQIYLPFLIVDLVVASVTISMGMLMLPPAVISLPFKLLLFVLVDGWRLVVEMLMNSFGTF